jgi:hypothetical protein
MAVLPPLQTSYGFQVFSGCIGAHADTGHREGSNKIARGLLRAGRGAFKVPVTGGAGSRNSIDPGEAYQIVSAGTAADVDAVGSFDSSTGLKTVGAGVTAGVVGGGFLQPARKLTVVFDASVDWSATPAVIKFVDHLGVTVSENVAVAPSGTFMTTALAQQFLSLDVPAQAGATGTATIGISVLSAAAPTIQDFFGVVIRQPIKTSVNSSALYGYPGIATKEPEAHYVDGDSVPVLTFGAIWVDAEVAVADRDPVYVRVAPGAGGVNLGTFSNVADGASNILVPNARYCRDSAGPGAAWARFGSF